VRLLINLDVRYLSVFDVGSCWLMFCGVRKTHETRSLVCVNCGQTTSVRQKPNRPAPCCEFRL